MDARGGEFSKVLYLPSIMSYYMYGLLDNDAKTSIQPNPTYKLPYWGTARFVVR